MAMSFAGAGPEKVYSGGGPIPEDSMVKVRLSIQMPKQEYAYQAEPTLFQAKTGLIGLNVIFEVISGQFAGRKIYETIWLPPEMQQIQLKQGQLGICESGKTRFLAILNAARGINENDMTPQAKQAQSINTWNDFNGLECGVVVNYDKIEPGDRYVNNKIKAVITMGGQYDASYQPIMAGGEYITDKPIPELPAITNQNPTPQWGNAKPAQSAQPSVQQPSWGQPQHPQQQQWNQQGQQQFAPPPAQPNVQQPSWGQPQHPLGPAFPSTPGGMDEVPF